MPSSPATETPSTTAFVCGCEGWMRSACEGLPFFKEHEGKRYCVLHYPSKEKSAAFSEVLEGKLNNQDFDFRGVWFPDEVNFNKYTFNTPVYFSFAVFSAESLFNSATFNEKAYFGTAKFSSVASFRYATFGAWTTFAYATFHKGADFSVATFKDHVSFSGSKQKNDFGNDSALKLEFAGIEKPDRFSFHTLTLHPYWFVNVDARKFEFINIDWNWRLASIKQEVESIRNKVSDNPDTLSAHRLLTIACRNLAVNAEENHRYEEASRFRYMAMEARRLERWRGFVPWRLSWWYWVASGYGERVWRAFVVLVGVWLVAAALYTQVGFVRWEPRVSNEQEAGEARRDEVGQPLRWQRALTYSLGVMTLQKPEPRPATDAAQALVMLETILGPVQAALLALAIRRKFMR